MVRCGVMRQFFRPLGAFELEALARESTALVGKGPFGGVLSPSSEEPLLASPRRSSRFELPLNSHERAPVQEFVYKYFG